MFSSQRSDSSAVYCGRALTEDGNIKATPIAVTTRPHADAVPTVGYRNRFVDGVRNVATEWIDNGVTAMCICYPTLSAAGLIPSS
ncbi:hypothetical protein CHU98_g2822 [Xylaria longipes]|nr:hypothetical protein CHU98_g2822 [Xylaria longipes]